MLKVLYYMLKVSFSYLKFAFQLSSYYRKKSELTSKLSGEMLQEASGKCPPNFRVIYERRKGRL